VDHIPIGAGKRGPITETLQAAFFGLFNGKTPDKWGWLEPANRRDREPRWLADNHHPKACLLGMLWR
jgi:hypothetical protein